MIDQFVCLILIMIIFIEILVLRSVNESVNSSWFDDKKWNYKKDRIGGSILHHPQYIIHASTTT